jgi:hypothetical protein
MYIQRHIVTITTSGAGAGTGYTPPVRGRVLAITYVKTDYANGVDFDVTLETTGVVIWDQDNVDAAATVYPRKQVQSTAGVALTLEGTEPVAEPVYAGNERVKIVVANGGATKTGAFHVLIG